MLIACLLYALYNVTYTRNAPHSPSFTDMHEPNQKTRPKRTLNPLDMRRLRLLHNMLTPIRRTDRRRSLVLGHIVPDGGILRSVLADMTGCKRGEEEGEEGSGEADPDNDHCGRGTLAF